MLEDLSYLMGAKFAVATPKESPTPTRAESHVTENDKPSLGDLNPLIHAPRLNEPNSIDALKLVTTEKIDEISGIKPTLLGVTEVYSPALRRSEPRFVARFEIGSLSREQLNLLDQLVRQTYGGSIRTTKGTDGKPIKPQDKYPPLHQNESQRPNTSGWYMGPNMTDTDSLHQGLFVFKDFGEQTNDNWTDKDPGSINYIVEIRETNLYQTDLVELITQVSSILAHSRLQDHGSLLYDIYRDLTRLGLKDVDDGVIYGLDEIVRSIQDALIGPLASPDLVRGIGQHPESVLLAGVPGTGKTLIAKELMSMDTGLFIVPLDPLQLAAELSAEKNKQTLLPRINAIARCTGRKVIIHIDDIEKVIRSAATHSTLLNLMEGVKEQGFKVIASTNHPEEIDPALIQPGRFGMVLYTPLQPKEARYEILKRHATATTSRLGIPLFASDEIRDEVLHEIAAHTDYFTPRLLAYIANVAKMRLFGRVADTVGRRTGLREEDLGKHIYSPDDWDTALAYVLPRANLDEIKELDKLIREFVLRHDRSVGFMSRASQEGAFTHETRQRLHRMQEAALEQGKIVAHEQSEVTD